MKGFATALLTLLLLFCIPSGGQDVPRTASLIQLIVSPDAYDQKLVDIVGFLVMGERTMLFLHQEDAKHGLGANSMMLISTADMMRRKEELTGKYVKLIGRFKVIRTTGGSAVLQLDDITACSVWSDPEHPRAQEGYGKRRLN